MTPHRFGPLEGLTLEQGDDVGHSQSLCRKTMGLHLQGKRTLEKESARVIGRAGKLRGAFDRGQADGRRRIETPA